MNHEDHVGRAVPQQVRSREKYERVLDAADKLFGEVGVRGTKMTILAKAAEMSVGSMYHLFSDRDEVASALGRRYFNDLMAKQQPVELHDLNALEAVLSALVDIAVAMQDRYPGYRALLAEYSQFDPEGPLYDLRIAQIESFRREMEPLAPGWKSADMELVIGNGLELARHFLLALPESPKERKRHIDEIKQMLVFYVCGRFRPDGPAPRLPV